MKDLASGPESNSTVLGLDLTTLDSSSGSIHVSSLPNRFGPETLAQPHDLRQLRRLRRLRRTISPQLFPLPPQEVHCHHCCGLTVTQSHVTSLYSKGLIVNS